MLMQNNYQYNVYNEDNNQMGNKCVGCSPNQKKKTYYREMPPDIDRFRPQNLPYVLPTIMFEGEIFNIQMINCPSGHYSLSFQISDVISIMLPEKQIMSSRKSKSAESNQSNDLTWKLHQKFGFAMNQFQLRNHFLVIQIYGERKTKIDEIIINLFSIATGPQHHDLQVRPGSNKFSRLKFDFKISQVVQVNISINQIKIEFDEDYQSQQFDYSVKIIRNNEVVSYSQSSQPKIIKSPQQKNIYRQLTLDDQVKSPLKYRKTSTSNKMIKKDLKSFVQWNQNQEKPNQVKDPNNNGLISIGAKLLSNDINKSFFYFLVWKFSNSVGAQQSNKDDWNLFAAVLINFNKLFQKPYVEKKLLVSSNSTESASNNEDKIGFDVEERLIVIEQPLWGQDGNSSIGKCFIKMSMKNPKFQKQLQACARTEDGIVNMSFLFKSYIGKNMRLQNQKILKIAQKYEQIEGIFKRLTSIPSDSYSHRSQILMLEEQAYENFKQIANIIKQTLPESFIVVSSQNPKQISDMIDDQLVMIDLMNKLFYNVNDNTVHSAICWEIVLLIMKRGQFYLENIGFVGFDKSNHQLYQKKLKCAQKYQSILFKYFLCALKNQNSQQVRNVQNTNIQAFKAYCYIKILPFRQKIIQSIQKAYDQEIIQLRLEQFQSLSSEVSAANKYKERSGINLNWDKYFHDQIRGNQQNQSLLREVQEEIENCQWISEISKRQDAFFNFTAELVKRLNELTTRAKTWKWSYFPGYTKVIRGFMVEMKKRRVMEYSQLMIKTSIELLANQELINIIMPIVIEKTNSFNKFQVLRCISMLQNYFNCLTDHQNKQLPRPFNYLYFFKSFKLIIETIQHTEAIVKALILIYDFYEWLSPQWRDNITMYLLGKVFFKLFFHWSFQIRIIFYNFLIIKVKYIRMQHISRLPSNTESMLMNTKINERYDEITTILINAENQKKQQFMDYRLIYEKELYKKMKNKIRKRKQSHAPNKNQKLSLTSLNQPPNLKQNQSNKRNQKFSLQNLLIPRANTRKKFSMDQQIRNKSSTLFLLDREGQNGEDKNKEQKLQITRGSSFCLDMGQIQNPRKMSTDIKLRVDSEVNQEDDVVELKIRRPTKRQLAKSSERMGHLALDLKSSSKLNYNIYNRQDHELTEISPTQINYIGKAIEEYRDTLAEINKYYQKKGELPKRELEIEPFLSDQQV